MLLHVGEFPCVVVVGDVDLAAAVCSRAWVMTSNAWVRSRSDDPTVPLVLVPKKEGNESIKAERNWSQCKSKALMMAFVMLLPNVVDEKMDVIESPNTGI